MSKPIKIKSIFFKENKLKNKFDNKSYSFKVGSINIFVGPNNCGKTQILKDIMNGLNGSKKTILLNENKFVYDIPKSFDDIISFYFPNSIPNHGDDKEELFYFPTNLRTYHHESEESYIIQKYLKDDFSKPDEKDFVNSVAPSIITYFDTDDRLALLHTEPGNQFDFSQLPNSFPTTLIEKVWGNISEENNDLYKYFSYVFSDDIEILPTGPNTIDIKYGKPSKKFTSFTNNSEKYNICSSYPSANDLGDGMRSVIGIICGFIASENKTIILLDEPELSLHPPQAHDFGYAVGQMLNRDNQQLFISTHSTDFLRGILSFATDNNLAADDFNIIRLTRNDDDTENAYILDSQLIKKISNDPVQSSFRVLDGIFYSSVVLCEGEKDVIFYRTIMNRMFKDTKEFKNSEIYFLSTFGWSGLKETIGVYRSTGTKFAIILDCDCVLDNHSEKSKNISCPIQGIASLVMDDTSSIDKLLKNMNKKIRKKMKTDLQQQTQQHVAQNSQNNFNKKQQTIANSEYLSDDVRQLFKSDLKKFLVDYQIESEFKKLCDICSKHGIFLTQNGELEHWFPPTHSTANKSKQNEFIDEFNYIHSLSVDDLKNSDVGMFLKNLAEYLSK